MCPRAYAFRVHALGENVGGWTIQRYFSRVVNCRVAFAARRLSTFAAPEEENTRREEYFENFGKTSLRYPEIKSREEDGATG